MSASVADPELVVETLALHYPDVRCELLAKTPWELLVAIILSARCSDERVNQCMAVLNEHLISIQAYAEMHPAELEPLINKVPLFRQKARSIVEAARMIQRDFLGEVPKERSDLMRLPGVGRKTAAVLVGNAYDIPAVAADVHVQRVVERLAWYIPKTSTEASSAVLWEQAVEKRVDPQFWVRFCHQCIRLGREHCRPKRPWCSRCPLQEHCPQQGVEDAR